MSTRVDFLTPVGRLVAGNLYEPNTTDAEGKPLVVKSGANAGQAREDWFFALAVPKGAEQHWAQTEWGAKIYNTGRAAFPQAHATQGFAWKVKDGDSQIPNRRGKKPCDNEGWPGHWVLMFSSGYAPRLYRNNGTEQLLEPGAVKIGYWVQVFGSIDGNGSLQQPGVYLNHSMVNLVGYGKEIVIGPNAAAVGFGQGVTLPPGVSATPIAGSFNPAAPGLPPGVPAMPGAAMPPGVTVPQGFAHPGAAAMPATPALPPGFAAAPPPMPVVPNPGFLMPPPPAVPAAPVRQMTAKAGGATYEQLIGGGWTDQLLVQHGLMVA